MSWCLVYFGIIYSYYLLYYLYSTGSVRNGNDVPLGRVLSAADAVVAFRKGDLLQHVPLHHGQRSFPLHPLQPRLHLTQVDVRGTPDLHRPSDGLVESLEDRVLSGGEGIPAAPGGRGRFVVLLLRRPSTDHFSPVPESALSLLLLLLLLIYTSSW